MFDRPSDRPTDRPVEPEWVSRNAAGAQLVVNVVTVLVAVVALALFFGFAL